jgi:hypothetical protein
MNGRRVKGCIEGMHVIFKILRPYKIVEISSHWAVDKAVEGIEDYPVFAFQSGFIFMLKGLLCPGQVGAHGIVDQIQDQATPRFTISPLIEQPHHFQDSFENTFTPLSVDPFFMVIGQGGNDLDFVICIKINEVLIGLFKEDHKV